MREILIEKKCKDVIKKASKLYNKKYDYSRFNYRGSNIKAEIICPIHGMFTQTPSYHLHGGGCPKCTNKKTEIGNRESVHRTSMERFIDKAKIKFGDKFNYSNITYFRCNKNIKLECPTHGYFKIKPINYITDRNVWGCPKCGKEHKGPKIERTTEEAVEILKAVHGDMYNYSKFIYVNTNTKGVIICKWHGEFTQSFSSHHNGSGCPKCGIFNATECNRKTNEQFIVDAKKMHGDKYDYSKTVYINAHGKVVITCKTHGDFEQTPNGHIGPHKNGCPKCFGKKGVQFMSFDECKAILKPLGLKTWRDWYRYRKGRPENMPCNPEVRYDEWKGINDWLGVE